MPAIYERQKTSFGGSFSSDQAALTIGGESTTPLGIVQNVQLSFAQQIARIYDVSNGGLSNQAAGPDQIGAGTVPVFYVGGRTQGQATIARVVGPQSGALCKFYQLMGSVCDPQDLTFTFEGGCPPNANPGNIPGVTPTGVAEIPASKAFGFGPRRNGVKYTVQAAVMTNLGISVGAQDMIVNENISLMFANLECDEAINQ